RWRQDPLLAIIGSRQYEEWQNLRHLDASSTEVAQRVKKFCANICRALQQEWLSPEERQQAEARQREEDERRRHEAENERRLDEAVAEKRRRDEEERRRLPRGYDVAEERRERRRLKKEAKMAAKELSPRIGKNEYVVWYGTNRRRYDASDLTKGYSFERDSKVHYGSCRVYIPEAHKLGSLGSPWWKRLITRSDDRLKLRGIKETDSTSFWHQIAFRLSR